MSDNKSKTPTSIYLDPDNKTRLITIKQVMELFFSEQLASKELQLPNATQMINDGLSSELTRLEQLVDPTGEYRDRMVAIRSETPGVKKAPRAMVPSKKKK